MDMAMSSDMVKSALRPARIPRECYLSDEEMSVLEERIRETEVRKNVTVRARVRVKK